MNMIRNFWTPLSRGARLGVAAGLFVIVGLTTALGYWSLHEVYVPVATDLTADRLALATRALEASKIPFRVAPDASALEVPEPFAGRARIELAGSAAGVASNQGLELFNTTDFAATEFTQRVNYQRALQGELTRTIQAMDGIRATRVHLVLPESNGLRKQTTRPSAAVALALAPDRALSTAQVRGIQRLVAAAVPDISLDAVTLVDFSGRPLTGRGATGEGEGNAAQLELKRDADAYFEAKLHRLLSDVSPTQDFAVSVDTTLNFDSLKVTTEQPVAAGKPPENEREAGVVVREHQTVRTPNGSGTASQEVAEVTDSEYEYKVGHRLEESLQLPGSIRRLSVAVVMHGSADAIMQADMERVIAHAVGAVPARGDQVAVLWLPATSLPNTLAQTTERGTIAASPNAPLADRGTNRSGLRTTVVAVLAGLLLLTALAVAARVRLVTSRRRSLATPLSEGELDALATRLQEWLREETPSARP